MLIDDTVYSFPIRIAYQMPVEIDFNNASYEALSSTFEDCMIYTNYELFKGFEENEDYGNLIKKIKGVIDSTKTFDELHSQIYRTLREGKSQMKAEFALDLIYIFEPSELKTPLYIAEGLEWLQILLNPEE